MPSQVVLSDDDGCFVCGRANPIGLGLEFVFEGDDYVTYFTPAKYHQGYIGITHGGIIGTVLDEVMARLVYTKGLSAVTAEITIRLKHPARTGQQLRFVGRIDRCERRLIHCSARAEDSSGNIVAEAKARMLRVA